MNTLYTATDRIQTEAFERGWQASSDHHQFNARLDKAIAESEELIKRLDEILGECDEANV